MNDFCVFDIETAKTTAQVAKELGLKNESNAFGFPHHMGFGIGCIYESKTNQFLMFDEAKEMQDWLWDYRGLLVSFNGIRFDLPVLLPFGNIDVFFDLQKKPHLDLLQYFYDAVSRRFRVSLNNMALATLNTKKSGNGADAPLLFQQGKIHELYEYCKQDVAITRDIFLHGIEKGHIFYFDTMTNGMIQMMITESWKRMRDNRDRL